MNSRKQPNIVQQAQVHENNTQKATNKGFGSSASSVASSNKICLNYLAPTKSSLLKCSQQTAVNFVAGKVKLQRKEPFTKKALTSKKSETAETFQNLDNQVMKTPAPLETEDSLKNSSSYINKTNLTESRNKKDLNVNHLGSLKSKPSTVNTNNKFGFKRFNSYNETGKVQTRASLNNLKAPSTEYKSIENIVSKRIEKVNLELDRKSFDKETLFKTFGFRMSATQKENLNTHEDLIYYFNLNQIPERPNKNVVEACSEDVIYSEGDHIYYRYEVLKTIGKGAFGQVYSCFDHKTKSKAAVKIVKVIKKLEHQIKLEMDIMKKVLGCENLIQMKEQHYCSSWPGAAHWILVMECLDMNLYELIRKNLYNGFPLSTIRKLAKYILGGLVELQTLNIVHCDLKPENIMVNITRSNTRAIPLNLNNALYSSKSSHVKIIDFGSSCIENNAKYTYIQSRFYRAPEVILEMPYNSKIDMFSFGLILCELYTGRPLFPGSNEIEQFDLMVEVLGLPDHKMLNLCKRRALFFDSEMNYRKHKKSSGASRIPASKVLKSCLNNCQNRVFVDLIENCLKLDPQRRCSAREALRHPWINTSSNSVYSSNEQ